jgi:CubicO group peptidase (beta-lactamase class C family)
MNKIIFLTILTIFFSCSISKKGNDKASFYSSKADSAHLSNIENKLTRIYSIKGNIQRMTIPQMMREDSIPGLSMVFIDKGKIVWTKNYGYANLEDSIQVDSKTIFTGASLSKPITSIAALHLVDKGILNLKEDVNLKLKDWKVPENGFTKNEKVTLERLIGHTSGIKNDLWSNYLPTENMPTITQMLAGEKPSINPATSVISEPGSKFMYSNTGYSIIQKLMMDVTGKDFNTIINEIVFKPCKMKNSTFLQPIPESLMKNKATGYTKDLKPYPYKLFPYLAAGGIWTTPSDLAKFMITVLDDYHKGANKLISKKTAEMVFSKDPKTLSFSKWYWNSDVVFRHYGSNQGFNCFMFGSVNNNQGIVVMTNSDNGFNLFDFIMRAVSEEYKWEYFRPEVFDAIKIDSISLQSYTGEYNWEGNSLSLQMDSGHLVLSSNGIINKAILVPVTKNTFILPSIPLKLIFPNDDPKKIQIYKPNGDYSEAKKTN